LTTVLLCIGARRLTKPSTGPDRLDECPPRDWAIRCCSLGISALLRSIRGRRGRPRAPDSEIFLIVGIDAYAE
jgi:hypothetical protein